MEFATLSGPVAVDQERFVAAVINSAWEKGEQKKEQDSSGKVARRNSERYSLALQGLRLGNRKVGSQVIAQDRSRFSGRGR